VLNDIAQGLLLAVVLLDHIVPQIRLGDATVTREHREPCGNIVPQKEPYFSPPVHGFGHEEVEMRIQAMPGLDVDVHTT
jgi:hypothetical protein